MITLKARYFPGLDGDDEFQQFISRQLGINRSMLNHYIRYYSLISDFTKLLAASNITWKYLKTRNVEIVSWLNSEGCRSLPEDDKASSKYWKMDVIVRSETETILTEPREREEPIQITKIVEQKRLVLTVEYDGTCY